MAAVAVLAFTWGFLPGAAASASVTPSPRVLGASLVPWFGAVDSVNGLEAIHKLKADHGNTLSIQKLKGQHSYLSTGAGVQR